MFKAVIFVFLINVLTTGVASAEDSPLMIIRFNQDYINYERQLSKAVDAAISEKPSVFFDVVAIVPETSNKKQNEKLAEIAKYRADQLLENIHKQGVASDKTRITYQESALAKNNELHIFVR